MFKYFKLYICFLAKSKIKKQILQQQNIYHKQYAYAEYSRKFTVTHLLLFRPSTVNHTARLAIRHMCKSDVSLYPNFDTLLHWNPRKVQLIE